MGSAQVQGKLWGPGARDWAELDEPLHAPYMEAVFDIMDLGSGMTYLDVGCGSGLSLELATKRGATVAGLDAATGMIEVARERAPQADVRHGDLEVLPFADNAFDAVTGFNSVQYAADAVAALREVKRVAKPDSPVGIVTWGAPENCETRVVLAALGGLLPPPPPGAGGPFALSEPGKLEELAEAAGLTPGPADEVPTPFTYADLDSAVRGMMASGPGRKAIEHAGEDATRDALAKAFADSRQPDGTYRQDNTFRYLVARA